MKMEYKLSIVYHEYHKMSVYFSFYNSRNVKL